MSFLDKLKRKGVKVNARRTSNLNPFYTARLVDIPSFDDYYTKEEVDNKVQQGSANNAKLNQENDFTQLNRFKNLVELKRPSNQANYLYWWDETNNRRIGYVGKASAGSDNLTIAAERGDLTLTSSSGEIKVDNKRIAQVANPTADYNAANKKYVDDSVGVVDTKINNNVRTLTEKITTNKTAIDSINSQIPNFARKDVQEQRWTNTNIFQANTGFNSRINMNDKKIINLATPTDATDAATKAYVDGKINTKPSIILFKTYDRWSDSSKVEIFKTTLANGVYNYTVKVPVPVPQTTDDIYVISIRIATITSGDGRTIDESTWIQQTVTSTSAYGFRYATIQWTSIVDLAYGVDKTTFDGRIHGSVVYYVIKKD